MRMLNMDNKKRDKLVAWIVAIVLTACALGLIAHGLKPITSIVTS